MSYEDGWAALNLEMPARIPRSEYSAEGHWDLINVVTGIDVGVDSPDDVRQRASVEFMRAWKYDFFWNTLIARDDLGGVSSNMGHAEYAAGGVDWDDQVRTLFTDPEDVLSFDPWEALGPIDSALTTRRFEEDYRSRHKQHPFGVNMSGIYITLVSGFIDLFGWEMLLLAAGVDPVRFGELANRYAAWMQQYFDALAEADVPCISDELPAICRSLFHLSEAREDNFAAGLSMGGYGAFKLALAYPERFAAAASLSGVLDIASTVQGEDEAWQAEMTAVFGNLDNVAGSEHHLFHLAQQLVASNSPRPALYQCCGTEDFLHDQNIRFREFARSLKFDLTYSEEPAEHEWGYWDRQIQHVLDWLPLER